MGGKRQCEAGVAGSLNGQSPYCGHFLNGEPHIRVLRFGQVNPSVQKQLLAVDATGLQALRDKPGPAANGREGIGEECGCQMGSHCRRATKLRRLATS